MRELREVPFSTPLLQVAQYQCTVFSFFSVLYVLSDIFAHSQWTGTVSLYRIKVKTLNGRAEILRHAKNLKDGSFKRVNISHDLTRRQQEVDKDLRQKLKGFREGSEPNTRIRGGKIVKKKLDGRRGGDSIRTTNIDAAEVGSKQGNEKMIVSKCKETNKTFEAKNASWGKRTFKCFMINARSVNSISKSDEQELYIKQNKLDIVAITERGQLKIYWKHFLQDLTCANDSHTHTHTHTHTNTRTHGRTHARTQFLVHFYFSFL